MSISFASSATVTTYERLILRGGAWRKVPLKVRYGLMIHPRLGPILIDTGYGPSVTHGEGRSAALQTYAALLRPQLISSHCAKSRLAQHGFQPKDVTTLILTHLHADHVSEVKAFPNARIITDAVAFQQVRCLSARQRLHHGIFLELLPDDIDRRLHDFAASKRCPAPLGLPDGYDLLGDGSLLAVPLPGHAHGHCGICFPNMAPALLYGVDTQWLVAALAEDRAPGYPAQLIFSDVAAARRSARTVRGFMEQGGTLVLCHDPHSTPYDVPEPAA